MTARARVFIVTGATSGVGLEAARRLAASGADVILHARSEARGRGVLDALRGELPEGRFHLEAADMASFAQVRAMGGRLRARWPEVHALVNNAGLASQARVITEDGFELTQQVNHLSHFLLTHILLPPLRAARGCVINVSSQGHRQAKLRAGDVRAVLRGRNRHRGLQAYADSKLANVLFTRELARRERVHGVRSNALHPGVLSTRIWDRNPSLLYSIPRLFKPLMDKPHVGGQATARLVLDPELAEESGAYFDVLERAEPSLPAAADALARELWDESARAVGLPSD